ncbi:MAG: tRNA (guanosine(37)-N1)-methyltransferase TrmD [bacterium]|nr:tRNA (guanosine(37)-N1)-methyltransferase TrmD [bacterium]
MLTFHIITLFPEAIETYFRSSILGRAAKRKILAFDLVNLRPFGIGKHRTVDDRPFGGGAGMVLMAEPICKAVESVRQKIKDKRKGKKEIPNKTKIVLFSAKGKQFNQKLAYQWANRYDHLVLIAGRYEGVDERVRKILKAEEVSIGPYVLTDGDVAAMAVASAVGRLVPGAIRLESLAEETHWNLLLKQKAAASEGPPTGGGLEYPHYTRPETFRHKGKSYRIPAVLRTGDHKKIAEWRRTQSWRK